MLADSNMLADSSMSLQGKNILLGISGGIAAYKCAELCRRLKDQGADVRVVMTSSAKAFITPLTMQAVTGHPVSDNLLDPAAEAGMGHIELAKWADLVLLAPASANLIARIAAGMANDLLTTLCLATPSPVVISPAMNQQMYQAKPTQENLATLKRRGHPVWGPAQGEQACGDVGPGRMLEPMELVARCTEYFAEADAHRTRSDKAHSDKAQPLAGLNLLLTAGPTKESIDPVRYISNHSSGKMGYALAKAARDAGAHVTLISGPVDLPAPDDVEVVHVESALEMHHSTLSRHAKADIFIACAAVADYRPENVANNKIKKNDQEMIIKLVKNPDILADVSASEQRPFCVGFAAETNNVTDYAKDKLQRKKLDLIAVNDVSKTGQGFNSSNNALTVFSAHDSIDIPLASKSEVAKQLISIVARQYKH